MSFDQFFSEMRRPWYKTRSEFLTQDHLLPKFITTLFVTVSFGFHQYWVEVFLIFPAVRNNCIIYINKTSFIVQIY
jgi:hypothetical protein